jgi:hypothetical protein
VGAKSRPKNIPRPCSTHALGIWDESAGDKSSTSGETAVNVPRPLRNFAARRRGLG